MASPTRNPIPLTYRILLTILEPLFALNGAAMTLFNPASYLGMMTRGAATTSYNPDTQFLYTELAGAWLYFAFAKAVILGYSHAADVRLWRLLCAGVLLSDAAYCLSIVQASPGGGNWESWVGSLVAGEWTLNDWLVVLSSVVPAFVRVLVVFGIGIKEDGDMKAESSSKKSS